MSEDFKFVYNVLVVVAVIQLSDSFTSAPLSSMVVLFSIGVFYGRVSGSMRKMHQWGVLGNPILAYRDAHEKRHCT